MMKKFLSLVLAAISLCFTACAESPVDAPLAFQPKNNAAQIRIEQTGNTWVLKVKESDKTTETGFKLASGGTALDKLAFPFELKVAGTLPIPLQFTILQTTGTAAKCSGCSPELTEWEVIPQNFFEKYARKLFG
jgi:hypothetical protein